jgi:hypothetical protein
MFDDYEHRVYFVMQCWRWLIRAVMPLKRSTDVIQARFMGWFSDVGKAASEYFQFVWAGKT